MGWVVVGAVFLGIAAWDVRSGEATLFIGDHFWFDVSRAERPAWFWAVVTVEAVVGLGLVGWGLFG